ncbi:MAG: hypothetical protein KGY60_13140 [Bacteroidales bacterium]|nr:hypothetical protein [Bacteroidales bacterium]
MIRNYLKTAIRNFQRNQVHALIITIGLATGLAAAAVARGCEPVPPQPVGYFEV